MSISISTTARRLERMPTGICGLDQALGGGLPRARTTLIVGGTGAGKTIFALQALAQGAALGEGGVLLTFEESPDDILANVAAFSWAKGEPGPERLKIIDGREVRTAFRNGSFDLVALLAVVELEAARIAAQRVVIDGIDVLLDMIDDLAVLRREVYRLAEWIAGQSLTAIITARTEEDEEALPARYAFIPFLTDCVIVLRHGLINRTAVRTLRILKCRGVAHTSNELPLVLSSSGIEIAVPPAEERAQPIYSERVSSGVARLDTMLEGGYLRGTSTLISGAPGTSKTSLAGAFAEAACARGERTLFVSFDEAGEAIIRNLLSVNIQLDRFVKSGLLRVFSVAAAGTAPEAHTLRIAALVAEHHATFLVVDPLSALIGQDAGDFGEDAVIGLLDLTKRRGVTFLLTSLLDGSDPASEASAAGISTIADTWIHLSYLAAAGERNRALTIIKSRGTGHSNQVRELVLSSTGVDLVDVYTAGGAVLMGTMRREKEERERAEQGRVARAEQAMQDLVASAVDETQAKIATLRIEEKRKKAELELLKESSRAGVATDAANLEVLRVMRGADIARVAGQPRTAPARRSRREGK
jgi:circadian clock protein KaiC